VPAVTKQVNCFAVCMYLYPHVQFAYLTHGVLSDSARIHPALQLCLTNEVFKWIYIRSVTASNSFDAYHPSGASLWEKMKDSGFVRDVVSDESGPGSLVMVPSRCFFFGYHVVNSSAESIIDRLDKLLDH
jgi:hypothetical protein